eukprot:196332-Hanusia_phi.AAC.8
MTICQSDMSELETRVTSEIRRGKQPQQILPAPRPFSSSTSSSSPAAKAPAAALEAQEGEQKLCKHLDVSLQGLPRALQEMDSVRGGGEGRRMSDVATEDADGDCPAGQREAQGGREAEGLEVTCGTAEGPHAEQTQRSGR